MNTLYLDFETRSTVDLKKSGADVYVRDPSTDIMCVGFAFDDEPVGVLTDKKLSDEIAAHIAQGGDVIAHNAAFELLAYHHIGHVRYGWPPLRSSQTYCTMAMALAMSLPAALDQLCVALGLPKEKDADGKRLMLKMSKPRKVHEFGAIDWWEDPEQLQRLSAYCAQDVEVERLVYKKLMKLSPKERDIWLLDYEINRRGIQIDIPSVEKALTIVDLEKARLDRKMESLTFGAVSSCGQSLKLKTWVNGFSGVETEGVAKQDCVNLLADPNTPEICKEAISVRQEAAKSSTAKLNAMIVGTDGDGRARGVHQYHAASTGRWGGRRIQTHNLPRPFLYQNQIDDIFLNLERLDDTAYVRDMLWTLYGPPLQVISDCLRGFITARKDHELIAGDFSNIEGRVLAWLANERWKIQAYIDYDWNKGPDTYELMASLIYNINDLKEITKDQRQIGKVGELSLGFQGGADAFLSMAKNYGVVVARDLAESIKQRWRENNKNIVRYWWALENNAIAAVLNPLSQYRVGDAPRTVKFLRSGSFLWCQLPSGRTLCYPDPKIQEVITPWGATKDALTYMGMDPITHKWTRQIAYGGLLTENITQAVARDVLAEALLRLEAQGYPVVMHVHDEAVCEVPRGKGSAREMENIMMQSPPWAEGLPIHVKAWSGKRYRKG